MKFSCNNRNVIVRNICKVSSKIKNIINSLEYYVNVHVSNIKIIQIKIKNNCPILKVQIWLWIDCTTRKRKWMILEIQGYSVPKHSPEQWNSFGRSIFTRAEGVNWPVTTCANRWFRCTTGELPVCRSSVISKRKRSSRIQTKLQLTLLLVILVGARYHSSSN